MARDLKLEVLWSAIDKVTGPARKIAKGNSDLAKSFKNSREELKKLNSNLENVSAYKKLATANKDTAAALDVAKQKLRDLKGTSDSTGKQIEKASRSVRELGERYGEQQRKLKALDGQLSEAGIKTNRLGVEELNLTRKITSTNSALTEQKNKLAAVTAQHKRLDQARDRYGKTKQLAGGAAAAGATGLAMAYGVGRGLYAPIQEGKHFALEEARVNALGLGKAASDDAIKFAKAMKTYGTSATENLTLVRDAMSIFADAHHAEMVAPTLAKMKFANEAMFGEEQGADNERKFMDMLKVIELRGGLASEQAFKDQANIVQKVLTATGGRVGPEEWLNVIKTGGLAAKGLKDEAFYYQLEPLVQEMGGNRVGTALMSAYQNLYQGRTTKRAANNLANLGLVDPTKVKHDKAGQISFLDVGAMKGGDLFRSNQFAWMEKVLLPQLASKGITDKDRVLDAIGSIFSNRTASNLFSQMYLQQAQIHKNAKLNAGADGIDQLYDKGRNGAQGNELEALAKLHDAYKEMSDTLLPTYKEVLKSVASAIKSLTSWMKENPAAASALMKTLMVVGALAAVFGTLSIAMFSILGPFAALRYGMVLLGMKGGGVLSMLFNLGKTILPMVGQGIMFVGRALLLNPLGLAITALAAAAYLLWKNWDGVVGGLKAIWEDLGGSVTAVLGNIGAAILNWSPLGLFYKAFAAVLSWFGIDLPKNLTDGFVQGFNAIWNNLIPDTIKNAADGVITWFKDKLGIHSPSRVFADLGGYTMEGLQQGIVAGQRGPLSAVAGVGKQLAAAGALTLGLNGGAVAIDNRAPIGAGAAPFTIQGDTIQITIQAAPGMDSSALAQQINRILDERERNKAARIRSALYDGN